MGNSIGKDWLSWNVGVGLHSPILRKFLSRFFIAFFNFSQIFWGEVDFNFTFRKALLSYDDRKREKLSLFE